jgi:hypothetical protein
MADDPGNDSLDDLLQLIEQYASTGRPLDLLGLASSATAMVRHPARTLDPLKAVLHEQVLEAMVERYAELGTPESVAFAHALAGLVTDPTLRVRLDQHLADAASVDLPEWLARLDEACLERPTLVRDLVDADEWLLAGVRLADGNRLTFRVEVDHDDDGIAAEGVLMALTVDAILERLQSTAPSDDVLITDLTGPELAARYREAIDARDARSDPPRSDTWPGARPLVEWALTLPVLDSP